MHPRLTLELAAAGAAAVALCALARRACRGLRVRRLAALLSGEPFPISSEHPSPRLGAEGYDIRPIAAPVATGLRLRLLQGLLTRSLLGRWLRRSLLSLNGIHAVRELAAQIGSSAPIVYMPLRALSPPEHAAHAELAAAPESALALRDGFARCPPTDAELASPYWGVEDYAAAYRAGATTPVDVVCAFRAGLERLSALRPFVCVEGERLEADAAASAERLRAGRPLSVFDGVLVAVKDEFDAAGLPTTHGSFYSAQPALADDLLVSRLRNAGALVVGKAAMHEVGVQPLGFNARHGGPRNPYGPGRIPGGSSSGSAVAVAAGLVPVALGADGGGSIRIPAALSGVLGLAISFGRAPFSSASAHSSTMVHVGPLATCARDAGLCHLLLSAAEPGHAYTQLYGGLGPPAPHCAALTDTASLAGVRIGVMDAYFDDAAPDVVASCRAALDTLASRGARIVQVQIPHLHALSLAHGLAIAAEFGLSHDLAQGDGHAFEPPTLINLGLASALTAPELLACNRVRGWAFGYVRALFAEQIDVLATPTTPTTAPELGRGAEACGESDTAKVVSLMKFIFLPNLLGFPAVSVPVGYDAAGLPIGLQLIGGHYDEALLLRLAHAVERSAGHARRAPPASAFFDLPGHLGLR